MSKKEMLEEGYTKKTIRYYFVEGRINHQAWGKNKSDVYNQFRELKGKKLIYNHQQTLWVK